MVFAASPRCVLQRQLILPARSTVAEAVRASELLAALPAQEVDALQVGVWGRKEALNHPLRDQDRVEIYRPLQVDPKLARRERFARQGSKGAGLFAKRRPGAKAGY